MKILQLVTERQYRGAQVFAAELSSMLAQHGHEVLFVGLYAVKENILVAKGVENIDLDGKKMLLDIGVFRKLIKLIKKTKPDIIQANGSDTMKYVALAKYFYPKLNVVYRNISTVSARVRPDSVKGKLNRFLFKKIDRVTSVGKESLEDLLKSYDYPLAKAKVLRRGVPGLVYDPIASRKKLAAEFHFPETDFVLSYTAQFSPEKNHAFLIESFERILVHHAQARLLFIGIGEKLEEIKALVAQKKLQEYIFFAGYRQHVQEILAGSDLFVFVSTIEGVPGVLIEAGMQSLATVAVNVGGVGDVVIDQQTGILLDKFDFADFSNAVLSLIKNEEQRKLFGRNAKEYVMEHFSLQNSLTQFENLYADILKEKKNSGG